MLKPRSKYRKMYESQRCKCFYCNTKITPENGTRDHVIPLSKGGSRKSDNIVITCEWCNKHKSDMSIADFKKVVEAKLEKMLEQRNIRRQKIQIPTIQAEIDRRKNLIKKLESILVTNSAF